MAKGSSTARNDTTVKSPHYVRLPFLSILSDYHFSKSTKGWWKIPDREMPRKNKSESLSWLESSAMNEEYVEESEEKKDEEEENNTGMKIWMQSEHTISRRIQEVLASNSKRATYKGEQHDEYLHGKDSHRVLTGYPHIVVTNMLTRAKSRWKVKKSRPRLSRCEEGSFVRFLRRR